MAVGGSCATAETAWRGCPQAGVAAIIAGAVLSGWIAAQVAIIGRRSFLQPLMGAVGFSLAGLGTRLQRLPR